MRNALIADERLAYKGIRKIMVDNYIIFCIVTEESNVVTIVRMIKDSFNLQVILSFLKMKNLKGNLNF
ncbi:type II toxin-antitoxin system RelE/ParE family toxin [Haloimpatiens sp. FM7315]|uniref:type II toxin-antitoxin system RelE/ParE family toxin n=1 Tax=Haloimpatiens sp. FM7315 TaxID=3298609 RepID=UPI003977D98E